MRILHVHSGNRYGGVESVLRVMARGYGAPVESVFALSFDGRLAEEIRAEGAGLHIVGEARASRPFGVLRARAKLSALFRQRHFDAVMAHSAWALSLLAHGWKVPLVYYQHDVFKGHHWTEKLARHVHPDLIFANSLFSSRTTSKVFPARQAQILHPPAALPVESLSSHERAALRKSHSVTPANIVVLIAARFEKCKGHGLLLDALASLRENPLWCLWIAGEPQTTGERELRDGLAVAAEALGISRRVQFLGHISNVAALMQAADLYCQPNIEPESFGLTFIEAMACGLPVVTTPLGGVREILEPVWGLLATPKPADVAAMIQRLLDDPPLRRRLGELGVARAQSLCDPGAQITAMGQSIASLLIRKAA